MYSYPNKWPEDHLWSSREGLGKSLQNVYATVLQDPPSKKPGYFFSQRILDLKIDSGPGTKQGMVTFGERAAILHSCLFLVVDVKLHIYWLSI